MSNWPDVPLGEIIELKRGYDLPSTQRQPGTTPIISSSGLSGFHSEPKVNGPGVVTGRYGTIGEVFLVETDFWPLNTSLYVRDFKGNDVRFIYYLLKTINWAQYNDKSGVPGINRNHVHEARVKHPGLEEQRAIAFLLGALDDKIKRNKLINETLDAMARALFKDWFVTFGPVRAKLAGYIPPGLAPEIAALFPDSLSEAGKPMGWEPKFISDVATVVKGKSYKSSELAPSKTALVTLKSFNRGGGYRLDGLKEFTGTYKPEQEVRGGDLVIAYTDVTQAADVIGKPALVMSDDRYEHLVISLDVGVLRPMREEFKFWLYGLAQSDAFQQHAHAHTTGTTVLHLASIAVPQFQFSCPSDELVVAYHRIVAPMFEQIDFNVGENRSLAKMRDALLPKLITGEVRIGDAEKVIGDCV